MRATAYPHCIGTPAVTKSLIMDLHCTSPPCLEGTCCDDIVISDH